MPGGSSPGWTTATERPSRPACTLAVSSAEIPDESMKETAEMSTTSRRAPPARAASSERVSASAFANVTSPWTATTVASSPSGSGGVTGGSSGMVAVQLQPHLVETVVAHAPARRALVDEVQAPASRPLGRRDRAGGPREAGAAVEHAHPDDVGVDGHAQLDRPARDAGVPHGVGDELHRQEPQVRAQLVLQALRTDAQRLGGRL